MRLHRPLTRRRWLAAAAALALPALGAARADDGAAGVDDGAARRRPLAVKGVLLDIARAGQRLVAVGERGHVLLSDDEGRQWRQAQSVPTRATLTALHASDDRSLWAAGHGGVILRSGDGGEHWTAAFGRADGSDVLLAIRVEADGRGLAVGGFGLALRTSDAGAHWQRAELLRGEDGERHLNRIFVSARSTWLIAAEGGHLVRSEDRGERWQIVKTPYAGSLWSGAVLSGGALIACGMRGNVVRSIDDGRVWTHQAIAGAGSLAAVVALPRDRCVLVGVDGSLVTGSQGGEKLAFRRLEDRSTLTGAVALANGALAVTSTVGVRLVEGVT